MKRKNQYLVTSQAHVDRAYEMDKNLSADAQRQLAILNVLLYISDLLEEGGKDNASD